MSRLAQRRMRHASLTLAVLLLLLVAMLPGAAWPVDTRPAEATAIDPYLRPQYDDVEHNRRPFDGIQLTRVGPPSVFAEMDPFDLGFPVEPLIPADLTLAPIGLSSTDGVWSDTPGWAFGPDTYRNPDLWIPPVPYRGNWQPDTSPTLASGGGPYQPPGGGLGGGGDGSSGDPQIVPEPASASMLLMAALAVFRPGRRPQAASTSPACPAI